MKANQKKQWPARKNTLVSGLPHYRIANRILLAKLVVSDSDHCVEYIRESLMCQPDLSMVTFRWINNTAQHDDKSAFYPTNFDVDEHTCANWQHLDAWTGERMFDLFRVDLLERPEPLS
jgi:hypothetical protein